MDQSGAPTEQERVAWREHVGSRALRQDDWLDRRTTGSRALRPSSVALAICIDIKYAARATVEASTACAMGSRSAKEGSELGQPRSLCKASCECCEAIDLPSSASVWHYQHVRAHNSQ